MSRQIEVHPWMCLGSLWAQEVRFRIRKLPLVARLHVKMLPLVSGMRVAGARHLTHLMHLELQTVLGGLILFKLLL